MMQLSPVIVGTMRLGTWGSNFSTDEYEKFIDACLDLGLRDFDHADIYGHYYTEEEFGRVIKRRPDLKNSIQITTKCGIKLPGDTDRSYKYKTYDSSPEHILSSVENSLTYLGVEKLDLLLLHRPDLLMDYGALARCIEDLKRQGKVLHFGVSNFTSFQLDHLNTLIPVENHQQEISVSHLEAFQDGSLDWAYRNNCKVTAWSPLGGGAVFAKEKDKKIKRLSGLLEELAEKYNGSLSQIMLSWLRNHPIGIVPVLGTSKISRIEEAKASLEIKLSKEDWYRVLEASQGHEVP